MDWFEFDFGFEFGLNFINVLFVVLFRRFGKHVLKDKLKWNIKKQLDLITIFQIHIPTGDKERKWQKNRKVWNTFALVLISLAKKLLFEYMSSLIITWWYVSYLFPRNLTSTLPIGVYCLVPFPSEWGKKQIGLGIPIIKSSTKTLLRSTFWWILGPVLRLLSGDGSDGFTESTTLGWIWMCTDTGWNQTYELLSFKHTIFFGRHFF